MADFDWNEIIITNDGNVANEQVQERMILVTGERGDGGKDGRGIVSIRQSGKSGRYVTYTIEYTDGTRSNFTIELPAGGGGSMNTDIIAEEFSPNKQFYAGQYVIYGGSLYKFVTGHNPGAWNASEVANAVLGIIVRNMENSLKYKVDEPVIASEFSTTESYEQGDFVFYSNVLYRFTHKHTRKAWTGTDVSRVILMYYINNALDTRATKSMIAPSFYSDISYEIGDYVVYQNQLYKFTANHTGAWSNADVTQVNVTDEIDNNFPDAPIDGKTYGRKDGAWSEVVTDVKWGDVTGQVSNQTDIVNYIDNRVQEDKTITCYVDPTNGLDTNAGTSSAPFATIQKAVDEVGKLFGIIHLSSGTYTENDIYIQNKHVVFELADDVTITNAVEIVRSQVEFTATSTKKNLTVESSNSLQITSSDVSFVNVHLVTSYVIKVSMSHLFSDSTYSMTNNSGSATENNRGLTVTDNSKVYFNGLVLNCRMGYLVEKGSVLAYGTITKNATTDDQVLTGARVHTGIPIGDAPSDNRIYGQKNGAWTEITDEAGVWGNISGNIADQADLVTYVNAEVNNPYYYFVDASSGSDTNDGKTAGTALATIQSAINKIPENKTGRIVISDGTYNELLNIDKKSITFACGNVVTSLPATGNKHTIKDSVVKFVRDGSGSRAFTFAGYLDIANSIVMTTEVQIIVDDSAFSTDQSMTKLVGINASKVIFHYCNFASKYPTTIVSAENGSSVYLGSYTATNNTGIINAYAIVSQKGSIVSYSSISGLTNTQTYTGGKIFPETINYYTKSETDTLLSAKAYLASPSFTGNPTAPTQSAGDNSAKIATTAFVKTAVDNIDLDDYYTSDEVDTALALKANLASPTLTGAPKAPTAPSGTNTTQLATTEFVQSATAEKADASDVYTKTEADALLAEKADDKVLDGGEGEIVELENINDDIIMTFEPYYTENNNNIYLYFLKNINLTIGAEISTFYQGEILKTWYIGSSSDIFAGCIFYPKTGKLLKTWGYIQSYNGENLPDIWISESDTYAPNTVPSIGAKVIYKLSNPEETTITPVVTLTNEMIGKSFIAWGTYTLGEWELPSAEVHNVENIKIGNEVTLIEYIDTQIDSIKTALDDKADVITTSASGNPVVITDGSPSPVVDLTIGIEPVQSGTGDPSPSNIRPISGWTGANITHIGKNLLETVPQSNTINGITATVNNDGSVLMNGTATSATVVLWNIADSSASTSRISKNRKYFPNGTYHKTPYDDRWAIQIRGSNSNPMTSSDASLIASYNTDTFTIDDTYAYNCAQLYVKSGASFDNETIHPWIHISNEYSYTFPSEAGTVYGGTLDVTTGVLTVTHAKVDMESDFTFSKSSGVWTTNTFYIASAQMNPITPKDSILKCSHFKTNTVQIDDGNGIYHIASGTLFISCDASVCGDTVGSFRQWLVDQKTAGTPVELWYELITPVTYQLTPTEVTTLLGENTISADTGAVNVTYRADTKIYIDQKIAESQRATRSLIAGIETEMVATKNYSAGDLLIVGDTLYKVTTNIANAGAITVGTNVTATTVAEQLILLANA